MRSSSIFLDLSELIKAPLKTGIQRVTYEISRRWPGPLPLVPGIVDEQSGLAYEIPQTAFRALDAFFSRNGKAANKAATALRELSGRRTGALTDGQLNSYAGILNSELFFGAARSSFYERLLLLDPSRIFFVVYDLLPWLHPEYFQHASIIHTMRYPRLLRRVRRLCFISDQTSDDVQKRLLRLDGSPADRQRGFVTLPPGSDTFGLRRPAFQERHRRFVCLGTIEPRKNHGAVLDAFERLWSTGQQIPLLFAGRMGWVDEAFRRRVATLPSRQPLFEWIEGPSDQQVADIVACSRAVVFPSHVEGYGLPPLESLALGVPVIVSAALPSIRMLPPAGQVRIEEPTAAAIEVAVQRMLDDDFARARTREIEQLKLPTWQDFVGKLANWIHAELASAK
jgi:glycosyltransferase involved in cell wall biosynthesis